MDLSGAVSGMGRLALRGGRGLLDALLPPHCLACDVPVLDQGTLCGGCFAGLHAIVAPLCHNCGLPFEHEGQAEDGLCPACIERPPAFERARAAFLYNEAATRLILPLKHGDRTELAGPLARWMAGAGAALLAEAEVLVPVPLHRRRLLARRYNQSALLARRLGAIAGLPVVPDALRRRRATPALAPSRRGRATGGDGRRDPRGPAGRPPHRRAPRAAGGRRADQRRDGRRLRRGPAGGGRRAGWRCSPSRGCPTPRRRAPCLRAAP